MGVQKVLMRIWKASQRIGFFLTSLFAIVWLGLGVLVVRAIAASEWKYPSLILAITVAFLALVGLGGLVSFWLIADHVDYLKQGYRVRWIDGHQWLFEERVGKAKARSLQCVRLILGDGYPAPSEVRILSEASWASQAPPWASDRRAEIVRRIARSFGRAQGGEIRFADL